MGDGSFNMRGGVRIHLKGGMVDIPLLRGLVRILRFSPTPNTLLVKPIQSIRLYIPSVKIKDSLTKNRWYSMYITRKMNKE